MWRSGASSSLGILEKHPGKLLQVSVVENRQSAPLEEHLAENHHARVPRNVYSNWHAQEFPVVFSGELH